MQQEEQRRELETCIRQQGAAEQILLEKQVNISLDGRVYMKRGAIPFSRPFHYDGKEDINALLQGDY